MEKGDLVQQDHNLGIVIGVNIAEAEIIFGDGQREIVPVEDLAELHHNHPVNFIDLVEAYIKLRGFE